MLNGGLSHCASPALGGVFGVMRLETWLEIWMVRFAVGLLHLFGQRAEYIVYFAERTEHKNQIIE